VVEILLSDESFSFSPALTHDAMNTQSQEVVHRGNWRELGVGFDAATELLPQALQAEGFGIITQIDLQQTFKTKLGADFRRYKIFGACSPAFALKAVETDPRAGLLLPCNVVLFERDDRTAVLGVIDPVQQLGAAGGPLSELARQVAERLARVGQEVAKAQPEATP
jgi:uncharacterized protein (DUF302 family)